MLKSANLTPCINLHDLFVLFQVLWTQKLTPHFKLFFALAILEEQKDYMVANNYGFNEILKVSVGSVATQFATLFDILILVSQGSYSPNCTKGFFVTSHFHKNRKSWKWGIALFFCLQLFESLHGAKGAGLETSGSAGRDAARKFSRIIFRVKFRTDSQGWRQGRARRGYSPLSEHASPPSEGEKLFCRRFLTVTIP